MNYWPAPMLTLKPHPDHHLILDLCDDEDGLYETPDGVRGDCGPRCRVEGGAAMTETGLPCIEGEGSPDSKGYRTRIFTIGRMKQVRLAQHRLAWEQAWGLKIPAGLLIRHSCDNPSCVNPMHLMIGTARDNSLDAISRGRTASQRKTHCPQGHELIEGNLLPNSLKRGWRACRTCKIEVDRQARLRRKAAVS